VKATVVRISGVSYSAFSRRNPGASSPMAELPAPEILMPVPVTRHPKMIPQPTIRSPVSP
jgi:hypothetical protein